MAGCCGSTDLVAEGPKAVWERQALHRARGASRSSSPHVQPTTRQNWAFQQPHLEQAANKACGTALEAKADGDALGERPWWEGAAGVPHAAWVALAARQRCRQAHGVSCITWVFHMDSKSCRQATMSGSMDCMPAASRAAHLDGRGGRCCPGLP